jgi:hypothetical protein
MRASKKERSQSKYDDMGGFVGLQHSGEDPAYLAASQEGCASISSQRK